MLETLTNLFKRAKKPEPSGGSEIELLMRSRSAPPRGTQELIQAYKAQPWLRAVVHRIADSVASVQFTVGVLRNSDGKAYRSKSLQRARGVAREKLLETSKAAGSWEEIEDHPLLDLLAEGNPALHGSDILRVTVTHLLLKGEAYWLLSRNALGVPSEVWPLPPHWVKEVPTKEQPTYDIRLPGKTAGMRVAETDVIAFRDTDPDSPYVRGTGIGEALADELDTDEYAAQFVKAFFYNGAVPNIMITFDGASDASIERFKAAWDADHRGPRRSHRIRFASHKAEVHEFGQTFKDMEVVELRKFLRDTVIQVFGVPPECLGIVENSNRATIESASYLMALYVTQPWAEKIRDVLQSEIAPEFDERLVVGFVSPIPDDKEFQLRAAQANPSTLTRGEWRTLQGLADRGEVDNVHFLPLSLIESAAPALSPGTKSKALVRKRLDDGDVDNILEELRPERLSGDVRSLWSDELKAWQEKTLRELGLDPGGFDLLNPKTLAHLESVAGERIKLINSTTLDALRSTLLAGVRSGEGARELAKRVSELFGDISKGRANAIARNEVIHSSNFGTWSAQDISGVVEARQWVATRGDDRTRGSDPGDEFDHLSMDGIVADLNEPFVVSGEKMMYPGDGDLGASAGNTILCRCTTVAVINGKALRGTEELTAIWKKYDREAQEWERKAAEAYRRGFGKQEQDIIKAIEALA